MSEDLPSIEFGLTKAGEQYCTLGDRQYKFLTDAFIDHSAFHAPENIDILAAGLNHFDMGTTFELIKEIDAFKANFRDTYAAEEGQPWDQYNSSISDFTMPDLDQIKSPVRENDKITFFVVHRGLGIPYRVHGNADGRSKLEYVPL